MSVTADLTAVTRTATTTREATSVPAMLGTGSAPMAVPVKVSRGVGPCEHGDSAAHLNAAPRRGAHTAGDLGCFSVLSASSPQQELRLLH